VHLVRRGGGGHGDCNGDAGGNQRHAERGQDDHPRAAALGASPPRRVQGPFSQALSGEVGEHRDEGGISSAEMVFDLRQ
jgi:hypothetical protein